MAFYEPCLRPEYPACGFGMAERGPCCLFLARHASDGVTADWGQLSENKAVPRRRCSGRAYWPDVAFPGRGTGECCRVLLLVGGWAVFPLGRGIRDLLQSFSPAGNRDIPQSASLSH